MNDLPDFKNYNADDYEKKISNKWRTNPFVYERKFINNREKYISNRNDKRLDNRRAVSSFYARGFPVHQSKGRAYSPEYHYSLIFLKQDEKNEMKTFLKNVTNNKEFP